MFLFSLSCATLNVVNIIGPNDTELNSKELSDEIAKANQYAYEAHEAKKLANLTT